MNIETSGNCISVYGAGPFSPANTFGCGQCFRWDAQPDGSYVGVAFSKVVRVSGDDRVIRVHAPLSDFDRIWRGYLDLDRDYESLCAGFSDDAFTRAALRHGAGLRILKQQPWEALCSFILSQCNNIIRIKGIVSRLCRLFGAPIQGGDGGTYYAFPSPDRLCGLCEADLAPLKAGYRAGYILAAARQVQSGALRFDELARMPTGAARERVMGLYGVGRKVADCFLLFGLQRMDAFPVDTWMRKAAAYYPGGLSAAAFGDCAGIAQQYIFHYMRSNRL